LSNATKARAVLNRLRRPEFDEAFPGLLELTLREGNDTAH
jgi:hypothetical protein